MIAPLRLAAALALLPAVAAAGGEDPELPSPYASSQWQEAQMQASKARLVIVGKVLEASKPEGKGWSQRRTTTVPGLPTCWAVDLRQKLVVEVTATFRGSAGGDKLAVQLDALAVPAMAIQQRMWRPQAKDPKLRHRSDLPAEEFALIKDGTYVFFLGAPEAGKPDEPASARHLKEGAPIGDAGPELLAGLRGFCRALAEWDSPPELSAEDQARAAALIADLGAEDFQKREKAEAELRAFGPRIRRLAEAAAKDGDAERAFRAGEVLKFVKPEPGKRDYLDEAGQQKEGARTFEKRPEDKPAPEPAPPEDPDPPEAGDD